MASLPSFQSLDAGDPHQVRARLVTLCGTPGSVPEPDGPGAAAEPPPHPPPQVRPHRDGDSSTASQAGRLIRWWVPAPLREARWDAGRPGALVLSLVAALAAVVAAFGVWRDRPVPEPVPALPLVTAAATKASPDSPGSAHQVVVSVLGRVAHPGLIRLPEGTRVADALAAVGGTLPGTDLLGLNIARRLSDGEQLLVGVASPPGQPASSAAAGSPEVSQTIDLNAATLEQLDGLPGVGRVTAQRILDWRTAHGRFTSVDQLRGVSGIGPARLVQLKHRVRV